MIGNWIGLRTFQYLIILFGGEGSLFIAYLYCNRKNLLVKYCNIYFENHSGFVVIAAIGRTLIPRYFRSIFEGGITDLYYLLKHPKESFHNTTITLDCDQAMMITHHGKPMFTKVCIYSSSFFSPPCLPFLQGEAEIG